MMKDDAIDEPFSDSAEHKKNDDDANHKKNDDVEKSADSSSANSKPIADKAKEFVISMLEMAKNADKRTMLIAKQKIEAKSTEFFRAVVDAMKDAKPNMLLAKKAFEKKAKMFFYLVMEMMKQINKQNLLNSKEWLQIKSRELIYKATKLVKETNYRKVLKREARRDLITRHGRTVMTMVAVVMMVTIAFSGNDGLDEGKFLSEYPPKGVRGRSLAMALAAHPAMMPFQPSEHSLHPKWRLWHDMTADQQVKALEELVPYFERYGWKIGGAWTKQHIEKEKICDFVPNSPTDICDTLPSKPCSFLSFGLHSDGIFEKNLAKVMECRGFVVDPVAVKNSKLAPSVSFQNYELSSLHSYGDEKPTKEQREHNSWNTSVPAIQKFLRLDFADVLRLDCEGCEIAMMRDILVEDPTFFHKFGQVSVKKHAAEEFVKTEEDLYYFGLMFPLLEEAGFTLVSSRVLSCKAKFEKNGCRSEFNEWGYICGHGADDQHKQSRSCQDFLFAKDDLAYRPAALPKI
ncbi:expressed unknown protein [Seminavis robusta]|uniref:Methyltransferase domain-containing protein n=1 Tax=Seminavis robusta TaxID=568900 RepID=A0A9N8ES53_9STRA|nr:expressed unknown protein [Seminavis robusta]|eukprot:Sro1789_g297640.1 n/a (516) ;mRNA; f:2306-3853